MTTSDARKRNTEKRATDPTPARPAGTPAPVAVPEGGWRPDDGVVSIGLRSWRRGVNHWRSETGGDASDEHVSDWLARGLIVYVHAPREAYGEPNDTTQHAPRTEPVTAPLPSEAVRALAAALYRLEWEADLYATPRGATTERYERRARRLTAALPHLLPAAADQRARDEGTVREEIAREIEAITLRGPDNRLKHASSIRAIAGRIARGGTR